MNVRIRCLGLSLLLLQWSLARTFSFYGWIDRDYL